MRLEHKLPSDRQKPGKQVAEWCYDIFWIFCYTVVLGYILVKKLIFKKSQQKTMKYQLKARGQGNK